MPVCPSAAAAQEAALCVALPVLSWPAALPLSNVRAHTRAHTLTQTHVHSVCYCGRLSNVWMSTFSFWFHRLCLCESVVCRSCSSWHDDDTDDVSVSRLRTLSVTAAPLIGCFHLHGREASKAVSDPSERPIKFHLIESTHSTRKRTQSGTLKCVLLFSRCPVCVASRLRKLISNPQRCAHCCFFSTELYW